MLLWTLYLASNARICCQTKDEPAIFLTLQIRINKVKRTYQHCYKNRSNIYLYNIFKQVKNKRIFEGQTNGYTAYSKIISFKLKRCLSMDPSSIPKLDPVPGVQKAQSSQLFSWLFRKSIKWQPVQKHSVWHFRPNLTYY